MKKNSVFMNIKRCLVKKSTEKIDGKKSISLISKFFTIWLGKWTFPFSHTISIVKPHHFTVCTAATVICPTTAILCLWEFLSQLFHVRCDYHLCTTTTSIFFIQIQARLNTKKGGDTQWGVESEISRYKIALS